MMLDLFDRDFAQIDTEMAARSPSDIPSLFENIPLDIFGALLLDIPTQYPHIKAFFPSMASEQVQQNWTGAHGTTLLLQSTAFMKTLLHGYREKTGKTLKEAKILDFGCGWGRLIRLLYKFTSFENIYAVDPWDESIKQCKEHNIKANLALSEWVPRTLPFPCHYDLIYAFSVFTHLSEKTAHIALRTLRSYIAAKGVLAITIRPKEYWYIHNAGTLAPTMLRMHADRGFAYTPHNLPPIEEDVTYGDASMSLDYLQQNFPQWSVVGVDCNLIDPYQVIVFLQPA